MPKKKSAKTKKRRETTPIETSSQPSSTLHFFRETVESIVIAFVLAFLFRTFEAEAFVIPTGSMSPSLQGQHKDVDCGECGYRFRASASNEGEARDAMIARLRSRRLSLEVAEREDLKRNIAGLEILSGVCPMCRQRMAFRSDLPLGVPKYVNLAAADENNPSYPGDRILVNKYIYAHQEPERWDVIVFKYPGNGTMNYIKRLVGLPGETLQIYQGDIFTRKADEQGAFQIQRKPPRIVQAMLQPVHDTDFEPASLYNAGWPLRWAATDAEGWQVDAEPGKQTVRQSFQISSDAASSNQAAPVAWLRYQHLLPQDEHWEYLLMQRQADDVEKIEKAQFATLAKPQLIRDFNPYNTYQMRRDVWSSGWPMPPRKLGLNWVGDLALRCETQIEQAKGELLLDLVEAGKHFTCRIDLQTGQATLGIKGLEDFQPSATTPINSAGSYELLFTNVDDQLLLWVDGDFVDFGDSTYDADQIYQGRKNALPRSSESEGSDFSPAGVGARGATLTVTRLEVLRDIYYVAAKWNPRDRENGSYFHNFADCDTDQLQNLRTIRQLFTDPNTWSIFSTRKSQEFKIDKDQFFVMGDNSPESEDCRLWTRGKSGAKPGGPYLDRQLLIGKAVCVFWPHSWGSIPGLKVLPGFPGFGDMRIIR